MPEDLDAAAMGSGLLPAFQPIVTLPNQTVIGYEALARWPLLSGMSPARVFERAEQMGVLEDLDRLCVQGAASGALKGNSSPGMMLFINSEPTAAHVPGSGTTGALGRAASKFTIVFELTERRLLAKPHTLLRKVNALRADGFLIALDDVGAEPESLALLDVISPEIIKLDLRLIQRQPDRVQARALTAILAHHERAGTVIVAEGIETEEHFEQSLAYGATLGQGYWFGRPGELATEPQTWSCPPIPTTSSLPRGGSIFELIADKLPVRTVRKPTLVAFSRHLERLATAADTPPIVLTTVQHAGYFFGVTEQMYRELGQRSPLVAVFGTGLAPNPLPACGEYMSNPATRSAASGRF
ncbi:hypothetical protein BVC93_24860 [Mycobacterium sp. MS1601]|uniref:EAL domain-containing protein n=1 Tax=Mycobacterium sp. MS1601 TaxID=1936029 RepID=UPI0009792D2C|nr:EAL domain-containing protein [Mycobacterium sp. MS1601]AQA05098.1 hypothetical protein BVC93_24860 [Mycobacterium sp. MS1601]